jgi:hypothetical protein
MRVPSQLWFSPLQQVSVIKLHDPCSYSRKHCRYLEICRMQSKSLIWPSRSTHSSKRRFFCEAIYRHGARVEERARKTARRKTVNVYAPKGSNFYAYVLNNPVNFRDPFGRQGEVSGCVYAIDCIHTPQERAQMQHEHDQLMQQLPGAQDNAGAPPIAHPCDEWASGE